jgi:hypothetical protein
MSITIEQGVEQAAPERTMRWFAGCLRLGSAVRDAVSERLLHPTARPGGTRPERTRSDQRVQYLLDMSMIGDALMEVTGAYRINYAIMGNSDPALHAHIVPRYLTEPEPYRTNTPWSYPKEVMESSLFDASEMRH